MLSLLSFAFKGIAFFFSSFVLWRRLRDDYPPGKIFSFTLLLFLVGIAGNLLSRYLPLREGSLTTFSFWLPFFLVLSLTIYLVKKLDFRLFEVVDSLVPAWLYFLLLYSLSLVTSAPSRPLAEALLALFGLIAYYASKGRYRGFSWYPSGKVGFLGLATLSIYFFARFLIAILFPIVVSFSEQRGSIWVFISDLPSAPSVIACAIISLILSIFFAFIVYLRSGRPGAQDLILKWSNLHFR